MSKAIAAVVLSGLLVANAVVAEPIAAGTGQQTASLGDTHLPVFTYRPDGCSDPSLLLVFHGAARDAENYRDYARGLADRTCMLVVAPLFAQHAFPSWRYQRGGIVVHVARIAHGFRGKLEGTAETRPLTTRPVTRPDAVFTAPPGGRRNCKVRIAP